MVRTLRTLEGREREREREKEREREREEKMPNNKKIRYKRFFGLKTMK